MWIHIYLKESRNTDPWLSNPFTNTKNKNKNSGTIPCRNWRRKLKNNFVHLGGALSGGCGGVGGCEAWRNLLWTLKTGEKGLMISAKRGGTSHDLNTHEFGVQGKERRWEYLTNSASEDWTESGFLNTSILTNSWTQNTGKEETRISRELSKPKISYELNKEGGLTKEKSTTKQKRKEKNAIVIYREFKKLKNRPT